MADVEAHVIKAEPTERALPASRQLQDPWAGLQVDHILPPPYDPNQLFTLLDQSETLRQCIDAMAVNCDGFGFQLDPLFPIEPGQEPPEEALREKADIERFFRFCNPEESFTAIRLKTRIDYEVVGYAFWEILREGSGKVAGIAHVPAVTMRLCQLDDTPLLVQAPVLDMETNQYVRVPYAKRFRRFAQVVNGKVVYFKEFGDPRRLNALTGRYLGDGEQPGSDWVEATEILYFRQYHPATPYGVPRWIGQILAIAGSRAAAEVNFSYFDRKAIPPLVIAVSGGRLSDKAVQRIRRYLEELQGRENFHSVLVIEADGSGVDNPLALDQTNRVRIDIKDLGGALLKDGLFMEYDRANREKIRSAFRLPPIYIGLAEDYTRATSEESHNIAEQQVFGPERDAFDEVINRRLFPAMGVRFWRFRSLSPKQEEPERASEIVARLARAGLTVREARRAIAEILNVELQDPASDGGQVPEWLDQPLDVYLERLRQGLTREQRELAAGSASSEASKSERALAAVADVAGALVRLRKQLEAMLDD